MRRESEIGTERILRLTVDPTPEIRMIGLTSESEAWRLPMRVIGEYEWIVVVAGQVRFLVEDRPYLLASGDTLLLEPDVRHCADWVGSEGCRFYFVHFQPVTAPVPTTHAEEAERAEAMKAELREQLVTHPFYILPRIRLAMIALPVHGALGSRQDTVCTLFERALAERSHFGVDSQLVIAQLVAHMLTQAARASAMGSASGTLSEEGAMDRTLQAALARIHADSGEAFSVHALAESVGVSQQYLTRLFSVRLGMPPLRYVNRLRMDRAKALMRRTRMDIQEIAWACGFPNPYYFSRLFRQLEGESPSRYRRRLDFRNN